MIRISDARNIRKDKMRMAMVNVWDARSLGDGVLQEGRRYMVCSSKRSVSYHVADSRSRT